MTEIREYQPEDRALFEEFRQEALAEGSGSLTSNKINPDSFDGRIWICLEEGRVVSISAVERSHYTFETDVGRICRYHILKPFRHGRYGFKMLPYQHQWASANGFKMLYWTHDTKGRALNELYMGKRRFYSETDFFFDCPVFQSFQLNESFLFKDSLKSDMLQYIYCSYIDPDFQWEPKGCVVPFAE